MAGEAFDRICQAFTSHGLAVVPRGRDRADAQAPGHSPADRSVSIRSVDGMALMFCHAGEQLDDVLAAVGLTKRDLFDDSRQKEYQYPDGRVVVRSYSPSGRKKFTQRGNTKGTALYHADRIADASTVYVVEGEKDCDAIESLGATAVSSAMGAGNGNHADWTPLHGKNIVLVADKDDAGRSHVADVARILSGKARSIRVVEAAIGKDAADHVAAGKGLDELVDSEIRPQVDDGAELLDDLHATLTKYVVFPSREAAAAVTLWIAATHAVNAFQHATRLVITSPAKRCGKSRLLDIIAGTCNEALISVNATVAAIFRSLGSDNPPTLIIDEADALYGSKRAAEQNEDLRALLNAGFQRDRPALRCVGPQQTPTEFATFAMCALAGIGRMPDTITDRAVNVEMRRRANGERVAQFRARRDKPHLEQLRQRISAWALTNLDELTAAEPEMPVEDRAADTWEPLVAVAEVAGRDWPRLARAACKALVAGADEADEESSLPTQLLSDVKRIFAEAKVPFLTTAELIEALHRVEESPWRDFDLNARKLSARLRPFGIRPGHNDAKTARGYRLDALQDAFTRYLRPEASNPSSTSADQWESWDGSESPDGSIRPDVSTRPEETADQDTSWTDWTLLDGPTADSEPESAPAVKNNVTSFPSYPPCFHCDKPVTSKQKDNEGRYAHLQCQKQAVNH